MTETISEYTEGSPHAPGVFSEAPEVTGRRLAMHDEMARANAGAFGRSPEVVARKAAEHAEPVQPNTDELATVLAKTSVALVDVAERAERAEEQLADAREYELDVVAYGDFSQIGNREEAVRFADAILAHDGSEMARLDAFVDSWRERDPAGAEVWLDTRHASAVSRAVAAEHAQIDEALRARQQAFANVVDRFHQRHPDAGDGVLERLVAEGIAATPNELRETPELFAQSLETVYERASKLQREATRAEAERSFREEFRREGALAGGAFGTAARTQLEPTSTDGPRLREPWQPVSTFTLDAESLAAATATREEQREASEQRLAEFRKSFAAEAGPTAFNRDHRAGAARAVQARFEEELRAKSLRRGRR